MNGLLTAFTAHAPIGDFGNYYYGSQLFAQGLDPLRFYNDLHFFNATIRPYEAGPFLENYAPVPPFSLLFYLPFLLFSCSVAKLLFNCLGAVVLALALFRVIRHMAYFSYGFYLLFFVFLQPLYSNFLQGQSYLLVAAMLLELFMAWQKNKTVWPGFLAALLFSLKIFPALIVLVFLAKRNWKALGWSLAFTLLLQGLTIIVTGKTLILNYYLDILPRLAANEITNPFASSSQSIHAFLMQLLVYHPQQNPLPWLNSPLLAFGISLLFYTIIITLLTGLYKSGKPGVIFFMSGLALMLLNKYNTVYALLLLLPVIFMLRELPVKLSVWLLLILAVICTIPVHRLMQVPLLFQYTRVWLLVFLFFTLAVQLHRYWNTKAALLCLLLLALPGLVFFRYKPAGMDEQNIYTDEGILYDYAVEKNGLHLFSCLGNRDTVQVLPMSVSVVDSTAYTACGAQLLHHKLPVYKTQGRLKRALFVNQRYLLCLSDAGSGVGMYHLLVKDMKR